MKVHYFQGLSLYERCQQYWRIGKCQCFGPQGNRLQYSSTGDQLMLQYSSTGDQLMLQYCSTGDQLMLQYSSIGDQLTQATVQ